MAAMLQSPTLDIDLPALRHNLDLVRRLADGRDVIASVKANAYGFGVIDVSRELVAAGVRKLWTGNLREAIALRTAGIDAEILMFGGPAPNQMDTLLRHDLQPTIFDELGLESLIRAAAAAGRRAPAWIKVDAGLGRLGIPIEQAFAFIGRVAAAPELDLRGVYSHLPFASAQGRNWALERYAAFARLVAALRENAIDVPVTQVWGSAGLLAAMPDVTNAVCVGHALFGLNALDPGMAVAEGFRPIISTLSANVLRLHKPAAAIAVEGGYGGRSGGTLATVAIGLGDGLRKASSHTAYVIIGGRRAPIKAFTLEHLMVDVSDIPEAPLLDPAILVGGTGAARISLEHWAEWTNASPLEVMMSLSGRIEARYLCTDDD